MKETIKRILMGLVSVADTFVHKKSHWVFAVGPKRLWNGDHRMLYEVYKNQGNSLAYILGDERDFDCKMRESVISRKTIRGIRLMLTAKVIVLHHGSGDWPYMPSKRNRVICNTWHGVPIKSVSCLDRRNENASGLRKLKKEWSYCSLVPASSRLHALSLAASFRKTSRVIRITGLPRNDLMLSEYHQLPACYRQEDDHVAELLKNKKLILYAPTFSDEQDPFLTVNGRNADLINNMLDGTNYVLGVRRHVNEAAFAHDEYSDNIINVGNDVVPDAEILLRRAEVLITDGSSIWLPYILRDKLVIWLGGGDAMKERGYNYDVEAIFPGVWAKDLTKLIEMLVEGVKNDTCFEMSDDIKYQTIKKLFHFYNDSKSSLRLIEEINRQIAGF